MISAYCPKCKHEVEGEAPIKLDWEYEGRNIKDKIFPSVIWCSVKIDFYCGECATDFSVTYTRMFNYGKVKK